MALSKTIIFKVKRNEPELVFAEKIIPNEIKLLSDLDEQEGLRYLAPIIFFYPPNPVVGDSVKTIRDGIAKTLVHFYPLAGRIFEGHNGKLMVNCNNEGVMFAEAYANVKLEQLGDGIFPPCPYLEELMCKVPDSIIACPLLFFQVTRFICGGFSLGIWMTHAIIDGYGMMLFLSAMKELINGSSKPSIAPVWQRDILSARSPPRITCTHNEFDLSLDNNDEILILPEDNTILTSIFFGPKEIRTLRNQLPTNKIHPPSRSDLITACLWKCRTIALEPKPSDIVRISSLVSVHHKEEIGLPGGYYGNGFVYPAAVTKAGILCERPLTYALDLIRHAKAQGYRPEYVKSVVDLIVIEGYRPKNPTTGLNYAISDVTSLGLDEFDLGWGKPLFGGIPWATPLSSIYSTFKNDTGQRGVVVPICLPALALKKFQYELQKMMACGSISRI